jgi:TolB-like protein
MTVTLAQPTEARQLSAEQRRALEILATAGLHGCTGAALFSRGFTIDMLADLVRDGLATARRETLKVGKRKITVARVWITDAGQQALKG